MRACSRVDLTRKVGFVPWLAAPLPLHPYPYHPNSSVTPRLYAPLTPSPLHARCLNERSTRARPASTPSRCPVPASPEQEQKKGRLPGFRRLRWSCAGQGRIGPSGVAVPSRSWSVSLSAVFSVHSCFSFWFVFCFVLWVFAPPPPKVVVFFGSVHDMCVVWRNWRRVSRNARPLLPGTHRQKQLPTTTKQQ